jgi:hypothetical protein
MPMNEGRFKEDSKKRSPISVDIKEFSKIIPSYRLSAVNRNYGNIIR